MAVSITHKTKTEEFVIPEPTGIVTPPPPSQTPIFDRLLEEFFKDRKDTYEDLLGKKMDPQPVYGLPGRSGKSRLMTQAQALEELGLVDDEATQQIPRIKPLFDLNEEDKELQEKIRNALRNGPATEALPFSFTKMPFKLVPDIQE